MREFTATSRTSPTHNNDEILAALLDAARLQLGTLSPEAIARIRARLPELTIGTLDLLNFVSVKRHDMLIFGPAEHEENCGRKEFALEEKEALQIKFWGERIFNSECVFNPGKKVRETHALIAYPSGTTIEKLRRDYPKSGVPRFRKYGQEAWYSGEQFASEISISFGWHLVLIEMPRYFRESRQTPDERIRQIPKGYKLASAVLEAAKNLGVFQLTGKYSNIDRYALTSDRIGTSNVALGAKIVRVGSIPPEGISIDFSWEHLTIDWQVGLALEREPEILVNNLLFELIQT